MIRVMYLCSVKTVALLAIAALVGFIGYKLIITADTEELASNEAKELELRNTFETKQKNVPVNYRNTKLN